MMMMKFTLNFIDFSSDFFFRCCYYTPQSCPPFFSSVYGVEQCGVRDLIFCLQAMQCSVACLYVHKFSFQYFMNMKRKREKESKRILLLFSFGTHFFYDCMHLHNFVLSHKKSTFKTTKQQKNVPRNSYSNIIWPMGCLYIYRIIFTNVTNHKLCVSPKTVNNTFGGFTTG